MERLDDRRYPGIAEPRLYRRAGVVGRGPFEEILPHLRERFLVPRHASPVARHRCGPKLALVLEDRLECVAADRLRLMKEILPPRSETVTQTPDYGTDIGQLRIALLGVLKRVLDSAEMVRRPQIHVLTNTGAQNVEDREIGPIAPTGHGRRDGTLVAVVELIDQILVRGTTNSGQGRDALDQAIEIFLQSASCTTSLDDVHVSNELRHGVNAAVESFDMDAAHLGNLAIQRRPDGLGLVG